MTSEELNRLESAVVRMKPSQEHRGSDLYLDFQWLKEKCLSLIKELKEKQGV